MDFPSSQTQHMLYQASSVCPLQHLAEQAQISSFINSL